MRILISLLLTAAASAAFADDGCEDVWFTRNLIMDRAGYCFSSPLGQALFDNSDCRGQQVSLDPQSQAIVNHIRGLEAQHGCQVNTAKTWIDLTDIHFRRVLEDLPIRDEFESACLGWIGPVTPLYAGRRGNARVLGQIQPGNTLSYAHYTLTQLEGWSYVTVHEPNLGPMITAGWLYWPGEEPCSGFAG